MIRAGGSSRVNPAGNVFADVPALRPRVLSGVDPAVFTHVCESV